jgi:hypothetical protein
MRFETEELPQEQREELTEQEAVGVETGKGSRARRPPVWHDQVLQVDVQIGSFGDQKEPENLE